MTKMSSFFVLIASMLLIGGVDVAVARAAADDHDHGVDVVVVADDVDNIDKSMKNDPTYLRKLPEYYGFEVGEVATSSVQVAQASPQGSGALGTSCRDPSDCASGFCLDGTCRCLEDGDCPDNNPVCYTGGANPGRCQPDNLALGAYCYYARQCASNFCLYGACHCNDDGDCPSDNPVCYTGGWNPLCQPDNLPLMASCYYSRQCASNFCFDGKCRCNDDGDCPSDNPVCYLGNSQRLSSCEPNNLALGSTCYYHRQCASNGCLAASFYSSLVCRCNDDGDCPADNPVCDSNDCRKKYNNVACSSSSECNSGLCCDELCQAPNTKGFNTECSCSEQCQGSNLCAQPRDDNGNPYYTNYRCLKPNNDFCWNNGNKKSQWCASGRCSGKKGNPAKACINPLSSVGWHLAD